MQYAICMDPYCLILRAGYLSILYSGTLLLTWITYNPDMDM